MGLHTSHNCWSGPYSQFMRWRRWLAVQIGIPLDLMEGFAMYTLDANDAKVVDGLPYDDHGMAMREVTHALVEVGRPIPWELLDGDPIVILLHHSDCEGKIVWYECKRLALRLFRIYRDSKENDMAGHAPTAHRGCYDSMRAATLRFAKGCLLAYRQKENVEFH